MSHINSVMALRERELQKTVRVFNARGSRVIRCPLCLLPVPDCICAAKPQASSRSAFCFVMYKGEAYKPTNTGRLSGAARLARSTASKNAVDWPIN